MWTVGLRIEMKLRFDFSNFFDPVWTLPKCIAEMLTLNSEQRNLSYNSCNEPVASTDRKTTIFISFFLSLQSV